MIRLFRSILIAAALTLCGMVQAQAQAQVNTKPDLLEVVTIDGVINDSSARDITQQVEKIAENSKVKAVLLIVDTPGGGAIASAVIYEELAKLKVPVVVWCQNLCASGGMFVSMAPSVKYVAVRTESISGSIGVIAVYTRFNRLLEWAKIDNETFKSGRLKDAGNPTREMEDEDRKYIQGIINSLAVKFYTVVEKSRGSKISKDGWQEIKSAKIFIGDEAVKIGLADAVMTREEVTAKAKELSGSKFIHTRDELKKMSAQASESPSYHSTTPPSPMMGMLSDVPFLIGVVKDIRAGEAVKFEYRMPYQF